MLFSCSNLIQTKTKIKIKFNRTASLRTYPYINPHEKSCRKKVSLFTFKTMKASLTIETALVLPIFLFAMITIIYLGDALRLYAAIQAALFQNAKELSQYAYVYENAAKGDDGALEQLGSIAFNHSYLASSVISDVGIAYLEDSPIRNGSSGLYFGESSVMDRDVIKIVAAYKISAPYNFLGIKDIAVTQRGYTRAWTGYDNLNKSQENPEEEMVLITPTGEVYHRSKECTHLKLSIKSVNPDSIDELRNNNGGKFKPCEICGKKVSFEILYITDSGDRYHTNLGCSGLKRSIITIPISKVGNRRPCSRCG